MILMEHHIYPQALSMLASERIIDIVAVMEFNLSKGGYDGKCTYLRGSPINNFMVNLCQA